MPFDPNNRPEQWATHTTQRGFEVWSSYWECLYRLLGVLVPVMCRGEEDFYLLPPDALLYSKNSQGLWVEIPFPRVVKKDTKSFIVSEQESS